jgi:hypothetical protein
MPPESVPGRSSPPCVALFGPAQPAHPVAEPRCPVGVGRAACAARPSPGKSLRPLRGDPAGRSWPGEPLRATPISCNGQAGGLTALRATHPHLSPRRAHQRAAAENITAPNRSPAATPQTYPGTAQAPIGGWSLWS